MENEHALPIGTLLADEYRIDGILGDGGFGITYRARDVKLDIDVAIKEYFPRDFASRSNTVTVRPRTKSEAEQFNWGLSQFIDEARRLARLQHPNIVRCMRYFEGNDTGYFVMTFEDGRTLDKYFPKPPQQQQLDEILEPLLNALEALHAAGIYHRDISPDNILIRDDDTPVLIDFGASRQALARRTQTVAAIVKPGYSPIEQYDRETRQQGAWSDIYALGATVYSLIAGGPPPDALSRVRSDSYVSAREAARGAYRSDFLDAIDWALEVDPDSRPVTIREWRRKLLPNPSGRVATAATRFEPLGAGKTLATRFLGADGLKALMPGKSSGKPKPDSKLRWPDYVLRGSALVVAAVFAFRMFGSNEKANEQAPPPPQPLAFVDDAEERRLPALQSNASAVWSRIELTLRRLGYLRSPATATTTSDIRGALKGYQTAIHQAATGTLNQETLNRILDETIELDPYTVGADMAAGRWFYEQNDEACRVSTGADRIEGRAVVASRPFLEFGRKRKYEGDPENLDSIEVGIGQSALFDITAPIDFVAGSMRHTLKVSGADLVMGDKDDGYPSRDVTRALRMHPGEVRLEGTSAYGGPLRIAFSADGFEKAYRTMATACGEGILYWIDDWAAVTKDKDASLWHVTEYGTEETAKEKAMEECTSKSSAGGCFEYASFKNACFVLTAGQERKNSWVSGWSADPDIEAAKKTAFQNCANEGGKDCELILHFCTDGSEEWSASRD